MSNQYFRDDEYRLLLSAIAREYKVCKQIDDSKLGNGNAKLLAPIIRRIERKIMRLQRNRGKWIPVEERLPENDNYILLSFSNFDVPMVGRYEEDEDGGSAFYLGDEMESCLANDLYVNAWQPMPEAYRED